ncbi:hypothetical protein [Streptomyces sp. sk226]|uniref:hypothetical protein n=1 Tax=Streptomyces sp. sk226 TaxID=2034268 RepID=UPI001185A7E7|nr:hypothetical protein [Streptomyces sp. sk226]
MTARRGWCAYCDRLIAVTSAGLWPHGPARSCRGNHTLPALYDTAPVRYWPTWHRGRRVTTIPGPDTWNPKETAA